MTRRDRIIHNLKEMMTANPPGQSGGFGTSSDPKGPTAGFDPVLSQYRRTKKNQVDNRSVPKTHRPWLTNVKDIINT